MWDRKLDDLSVSSRPVLVHEDIPTFTYHFQGPLHCVCMCVNPCPPIYECVSDLRFCVLAPNTESLNGQYHRHC